MNVYLVTAAGELVTPALSGTILEGVTRDSILTLAREFGLTPVERQIALTELLEGVDSGKVSEVFACGTAAVVTPVGTLRWDGGEVSGSATEEAGPLTTEIRQDLVDIQYGRTEDAFGWMHRVV